MDVVWIAILVLTFESRHKMEQRPVPSLPFGVCLSLKKGWVPVVDDRKGIRPQNLCTYYTSRNVLSLHSSFYTAMLSPCGMVLHRMYGESIRKPANLRSPGRMIIKMVCVRVCLNRFSNLELWRIEYRSGRGIKLWCLLVSGCYVPWSVQTWKQQTGALWDIQVQQGTDWWGGFWHVLIHDTT